MMLLLLLLLSSGYCIMHAHTCWLTVVVRKTHTNTTRHIHTHIHSMCRIIIKQCTQQRGTHTPHPYSATTTTTSLQPDASDVERMCHTDSCPPVVRSIRSHVCDTFYKLLHIHPQHTQPDEPSHHRETAHQTITACFACDHHHHHHRRRHQRTERRQRDDNARDSTWMV